MNTHIKKISIYGKGIYKQLLSMFLELPRNKQVAVVGVAMVILYGVIHLFTSNSEKAEDIIKSPRSVVLRSVSEITNKESSVPLLGIVTSTSEATIRSESSGKLTRVYKKLGDYVYAGEIIAEFENSAERAQVQQAEGAYEAAKASRDISKINNNTTISSLADSKTNALNTLSNAYTAMDDAIHTKTDSAFSDPREINAKFLPIVPSMSLIYSLETTRVEVEKMLTARSIRNKTLTTSDDLASEIVTMQKEVTFIKTYLDDLATAYSKSIPDSRFSQATLDNSKASINITRSTLSGILSSLSGAKTSLTASTNAEASISGTGTYSGSTGAVDAQVKQALGLYNGALSRLEKTIIRSTITGTLNSLNIQTGDFITQFSEVAVVSNNGALEVVTYVTDDDAKRIQTGNTVSIAPNIQGVITRIASGIDPTTKKIEVRVGILSKSQSLINGQSVQLRVSRSIEKKTNTNNPISIPISALKITPTKSLVFTVNSSSTLVEMEVTTGAILGEEIQILSGLTQETTIVTDARGLKEGMEVTISTK